MLESFFKKDFAGIYFSSKGISIVQQSSGKIKNQMTLPYPPLGEQTAQVLSSDIFDVFKNKDVELTAFLQKAIRDSKIDTSDIVVALPPKDLIVRFFEMPNIPRSELLAGINFEMKKYIPFKIEELAYDFQYHIKQKANIIEVVLCGIKQEPLDRYINLFRQLELKVAAFEPGLFSLFRLLILKNKISNKHSYVILEFDREDANILIVDKGFTYFTRDIKLISGAAAAGSPEDFEAILFRLVNELRVSIDYYRRQFLKKDVDEMIVIANKSFSGFCDHFSKELGLKANFIPLNDVLKIKDVAEDMLADLSKAFGASLKALRPSLVTLNLGKLKEKAEKTALSLAGISSAQIQQGVFDFFKETRIALIQGSIIGVFVIIIAYGLGFSKLFPLEREFASATVKQPPLLPGVDVATLDSVKTSEATFSQKQRDLKGLLDSSRFFYKKLAILPKLMPESVWLNSLMYNREINSLMLGCSSYASEEKERSDNMDHFILNLKKSPDFVNDYPSIELKSYRETNQEGIYYLQFDVSCGTGKRNYAI